MKRSDKKYLNTVSKRFSGKFSRNVPGGVKPFDTIKKGIEGLTEGVFYVKQPNITTMGTTTAYTVPYLSSFLGGTVLTDGVRLYINPGNEDGLIHALDVDDPTIVLWTGGNGVYSSFCCDGNLYFDHHNYTHVVTAYNLETGLSQGSATIISEFTGSYGTASNGNRITSLVSEKIWIADSVGFSSVVEVIDVNVKTFSSVCIGDDRLYYTSYDGAGNTYLKSLDLISGSLVDSITLLSPNFAYYSSVCTDGELVFVKYGDAALATVCCYTRDLNLVWTSTVTSYARFAVDEKYLYYIDVIGGSLSNLVVMDKYLGIEVWRSGNYPESWSPLPCTDGRYVYMAYKSGVDCVIRRFSTGKIPVYMRVSGTDKQRKPMFNLAVPL